MVSESEIQAPRRLRAVDEIERLAALLEMALAGKPPVPSVSFEATRNAKGETQIAEAKVYAPMGCDLEALAVHAGSVRLIAQENYDAMTAWHPAASGFVTNDAKAKS